jgi:hypothetical protein
MRFTLWLGALLASLVLVAVAVAAPARTANLDFAEAWSLNPDDNNFHFIYYVCPAVGENPDYGVWGTGTYTSDSAVCMAAVHAGKFTFMQGGMVKIDRQPGLADYQGSTQHGVESSEYGDFDDSFSFALVVVGNGHGVGLGNSINDWFSARGMYGGGSWASGSETWKMTAQHLRGANGAKVGFHCDGSGRGNRVWGTGPYTDDSSICTAAVHAGKITFAKGGDVTIQISAGKRSYAGSNKNGVTTRTYGSFGGSFSVV